MSYKQDKNRPVKEGGTEQTSFISYSVIIAGSDTQDPLTYAPPGDSGNILISNGTSSPGSFQTPPIPQMNFQVLASDPASPEIGQVWYNSTDDVYRGAQAGGVWVAENNLNTARRDVAVGGAGDTSDALSIAGFTSVVVTTVERWDGTSWTAKTGVNTGVNQSGGCGTAEDAIVFGGSTTGAAAGATGITETYSGTGDSWTTKSGTLNTPRLLVSGAGTQSDALSINGVDAALARNGITERYSLAGDAWTNKGATSAQVSGCGSAGSADDALSFGGLNGSGTTVATTELFDGAGAETWSSKANLNTAVNQGAGCGASSGNGLSFGGFLSGGPATGICEEYDRVGNSWSSRGSMNTARRLLGGVGTSSNALSFAGLTGSGVTAATESYTNPTIVTFTVT